jgi:hypothetical protein
MHIIHSLAQIDSRLTMLLTHDTPTTQHGVLLWGPPGCGKSSSAQELSDKYSPMHFVNVDAVVEYIINTYYAEEWKNAKHDDQLKQALYFEIRNTMGYDILAKKIKADGNTMTLLYELVMQLAHITFDIQSDETGLMRYLLKKHRNFVAQPITALYADLVVWTAKRRGESFMIETTGNTFDAEWTRSTFEGVHSQLRIVYVDDPETLVRRVQSRTAQLINADPERVRQVFDRAYGESVLKAMRSRVFNLIDVCDNSGSTPVMLLTITKVGDAGYEMDILGHNNSSGATRFIATLREGMGHTQMGANLFCLRAGRFVTRFT